MRRLLPRLTLSVGAILRWHLVRGWFSLLAERQRPVRLLDVGCGRGEYVFELARAFPNASRIVGVDEQSRHMSGPFLAIPPRFCPRVRLICERFSSSAVTDHGPFDGILCIDVLEHIADDAAFLDAIASISAPHARLLIHVPATNQLHPVPWARCEIARLLAMDSDQHVREGYSIEGLRRLMESTGWRVLRLQATFGRAAAWACDLDFYLAEHRMRWLRVLGLPVVILGAIGSRLYQPGRGNGWLLLAER